MALSVAERQRRFRERRKAERTKMREELARLREHREEETAIARALRLALARRAKESTDDQPPHAS